MARGAIGGLAGGIAMGMWMMAYYLFGGLGFWTPVVTGSPVSRSAPGHSAVAS
jgi:hypothetical protein